ncbi:MAG TPA: esterase, partial [Flavobacteriales bacterium]|nr:esterase [Flavobacteriales bacterium]
MADYGQQLKEKSLYITLNSTEKLHVKRFFTDKKGQPVLMLHGSIENGKIFYSSSGKGLAPYLAH